MTTPENLRPHEHHAPRIAPVDGTGILPSMAGAAANVRRGSRLKNLFRDTLWRTPTHDEINAQSRPLQQSCKCLGVLVPPSASD